MREKYESLSLATLKDLAKARGLRGISTLRKPELIERMLQEDEKESQTKPEAAETTAVHQQETCLLYTSAAGVFGSLAQQMMEPMNPNNSHQSMYQKTAQHPGSSGRYGIKKDSAEIKQAQQKADKSPMEVLSEMKQLLEKGYITQEQYDAKVDEVLKRM